MAPVIEREASKHFGDQKIARTRAANYFALFEVLKKPQDAQAAWLNLQNLACVDEPIAGDDLRAAGRLDLDSGMFAHALANVVGGFRALASTDMILEYGRPGYPELLAKTDDAPPFLFVRQQENVLALPSLSIVGTREASDDGVARAMRLAHLLSRRGIAVCSGLARGIDTAAHTATLRAGGVTIAVIGTPLTRTYPAENGALQQRIGAVGAVVSQFHPTAKTLPYSFPIRNATMSGLSLGTVVIEASETSGALIQARKALQQGRKVFIPRSAIEDERIAWPRNLVSRGANVFSTIEDLVSVLEADDLIPRRDLSPPAHATVALHAP